MNIKTLSNKPTFRDLLNILSEMPEEHLDDSIVVYDVDYDGFVSVESIGEVSGNKNIADGSIVFNMASG